MTNSSSLSPAPSERRLRGFCPDASCGHTIEAVSFRDPGEINDSGAVVAACDRCGAELSIAIVNPSDALVRGASAVRILDDGESPAVPAWREPLQIFFDPVDEPTHDAGACNLFRCDFCDAPVEERIQTALDAALPGANDALAASHNYYLKGSIGEPAFTVIRGEAACACGAALSYTAYRTFDPHGPIIETADGLLIASVKGAEGFAELDGIFTRDECEALVTKLMRRWRLLFPSAVMATPFVGFSMEKKKVRFCSIWDRLLSLVDAKSVTLVTRKRTVTEYRMAVEEQDKIEFAMLERYGLLHPALTTYVKENKFHAKFYASVDEANDRVEALIGSFNFQEGGAKENMTLRLYSNAQFRRRYLDRLGVRGPIPARDAPHCLIVDLRGGSVRSGAGRLA